MKLRRVVILLLVAALVVGLFAGCNRPKARTDVTKGDLAATQELRYNLGTEPQTLDPCKSTGVPEMNVHLPMLEGLTRVGLNNQIVPGVATKWEVSPDGKVYTFHLRKAKWSNGDPLTAEDFKWSWLRACAPETAGDYAYQLWYIKNAQAYTEGTVSADEVGIKVINPQTLEVTLEYSAPYFLEITAFDTLLPVHRATAEAQGDKFGSEAAGYVCNGPFVLTEWVHNDHITYVKNNEYWDKDNVFLDKLTYYMVEEASTELTMYETGQIDIGDNPPLPDHDRLVTEGKLQTAPLIGTYYYIFNCEQKPFDDPRVRKALTLGLNRADLIKNVLKGAQMPATAFVCKGINEGDKDFRDVGGSFFKDADIAEAQRLLAEAGYPGGKGFPAFEILYNTSESHKAIAEAICEMWKTNLGISGIKLVNQEWGVYLDSRDAGAFQVARAGWIGDYSDPMTFLDMWTTGNGNNNTRWGDAEYDKLVEEAKREQDPAKRFAIMHKIEEILMRDMPILPIYFYADEYVMQPYVGGVIRSPLGPIEFKFAYIKKH
ncbi:MAG: peptide ABC transporter substrate-binding protein [Chloroflexota bacterium]